MSNKDTILDYLQAMEDRIHGATNLMTSPEDCVTLVSSIIHNMKRLVRESEFSLEATLVDAGFQEVCKIPCLLKEDQEFLILQPLQEITEDELMELSSAMTSAREQSDLPTDRTVVILPFSVKFLRAKIHLPEKE